MELMECSYYELPFFTRVALKTLLVAFFALRLDLVAALTLPLALG